MSRRGQLGVSLLLWLLCLTGISVSSLSDGIFVLHMPSEDRKQKVSGQLPSAGGDPGCALTAALPPG